MGAESLRQSVEGLRAHCKVYVCVMVQQRRARAGGDGVPRASLQGLGADRKACLWVVGERRVFWAGGVAWVGGRERWFYSGGRCRRRGARRVCSARMFV